MTSPHILVVEADPFNRDLYVRMLVRCLAEATVQTVVDGHTAIRHIRTTRVDVVILSDQIGLIEPLNLVILLRYHAPMVPIMLLTSYDRLERDAALAGVQQVVRKPFTLDRFRTVVTALVPPVDPSTPDITTPH